MPGILSTAPSKHCVHVHRFDLMRHECPRGTSGFWAQDLPFGDKHAAHVSSNERNVAGVLNLLCSLQPAIPQPTPACPLQFYELARKEIGALILSDEHPNIVRCFAMEEDSEFVYLALERCRQSLADLVTGEGGSVFLVDEAKHPTPFCMQASRLWRPSRHQLAPVSLVLWQSGSGLL